MKKLLGFGVVMGLAMMVLSCAGTDMKKVENEARAAMKNMVASMNDIAGKLSATESPEEAIKLIKKSGELFKDFNKELTGISDKYKLSVAQDDELQASLSDVYEDLGAASETLKASFDAAAIKFADDADFMEQMKTTMEDIVEASQME
ncbi:MAG: hypothetical protein HPY53_03560 [Brevinematales bacterium]|nr:hypothetical protein [Brevinematales bacterium]